MTTKLAGLGKRDPDEFLGWMDGYCSAFNDMPDGAWQACCETAVDDFNKQNGTHIDSHDGWLFWVFNRKD